MRDGAGMRPLVVTARLRGAISLPHGPIALDGLLAWAVAQRDGLPPALTAAEALPIKIPIEREPRGRFHLASSSMGMWEAHEHRWVNRRYPVGEAQSMGDAHFRAIKITAGRCKSFRLPLEAGHMTHDTLTWFCIGLEADVRALLVEWVAALGKKRSVGLGRVQTWTVEPCTPWGDGFPVVRADGQPLRPVPIDWPGLAPDCEQAWHTVTYPYWDRTAEVLCAVPSWR